MDEPIADSKPYAAFVFNHEGEPYVLRSDYERLREMLRWIPVSERLPDVDELVIVCVGGGFVTPLRRHKQDGFWQHEDGDIDEIIVTHWMPLPEPPEVK